MYVIEVLGSLWPDAEATAVFTFHYLKPKAILTGAAEPLDLGVLALVILAAMLGAGGVPRRDLAAPS